jgi:hypothetical protein
MLDQTVDSYLVLLLQNEATITYSGLASLDSVTRCLLWGKTAPYFEE